MFRVISPKYAMTTLQDLIAVLALWLTDILQEEVTSSFVIPGLVGVYNGSFTR
jgi:hypothetical protein